MDINRWWRTFPSERYWLEVTDRADLGIDLNAPQRREGDQEYYGYSLIYEISEGDAVFHYHKGNKAVVAVSRATGGVWVDTVLWGARGTFARNNGIQPYKRPGWRLGLDAFQALSSPVTLEDLRSHHAAIQAIRERLERTVHGGLYFPFELSETRDLRPTQAYITKLPAEVVQLFPQMVEAAQQLEINSGGIGEEGVTYGDVLSTPLGVAYRRANEELAISHVDPFFVDPSLVERANREHASAQNALASYLVSCGLEPRSPAPDEPNYDLAWTDGEVVYVTEVKSLTDANEEKQLRLGLGQVLRYRNLLSQRYPRVCAVLITERSPRDRTWKTLCDELHVLLTSSDALSFGHATSSAGVTDTRRLILDNR